MGYNILVTGAAGYIGGSLIESFLSGGSNVIQNAKIFGTVRTDQQAEALSELPITLARPSLEDEKAILQAILKNEIDIIVNTANSWNASVASNLIKALGHRRVDSGRETYFIQSSITTIYSEHGGWPFGEVRDTDPLYEMDKRIEAGHPVRDTNNLITELGKAHGVTTFIMAVPVVYGTGTGKWRRLSVNIPTYVRTSVRNKAVHKFDEDGSPPAAHISDLVALYALLVESILQGKQVPSGEDGYYFAMAHRAPWWAAMSRIAQLLHARGLVTDPEVKVWPSDEMAADTLGFPRQFVRAMNVSSGQLVPIKAYQLGWRPKWNEEMLLNGLDEEVDEILKLDTIKATLFEPLKS
ncbi:NAD(P)-binding protein [Xylariomycetidae sp. FL2044]|nr:NAD(P)-binding protein [Xylariomycetidae sp. FL2044]